MGFFVCLDIFIVNNHLCLTLAGLYVQYSAVDTFYLFHTFYFIECFPSLILILEFILDYLLNHILYHFYLLHLNLIWFKKLDEADRDGDGEISEDEFLRIMKKTSLY